MAVLKSFSTLNSPYLSEGAPRSPFLFVILLSLNISTFFFYLATYITPYAK